MFFLHLTVYKGSILTEITKILTINYKKEKIKNTRILKYYFFFTLVFSELYCIIKRTDKTTYYLNLD